MVVFAAAYLKPAEARGLYAFFVFLSSPLYLVLVEKGIPSALSTRMFPRNSWALSLFCRRRLWPLFTFPLVAVFVMLCFTVDGIASMLYQEQRQRLLRQGNERASQGPQ